jgi:hypothetical protein
MPVLNRRGMLVQLLRRPAQRIQSLVQKHDPKESEHLGPTLMYLALNGCNELV